MLDNFFGFSNTYSRWLTGRAGFSSVALEGAHRIRRPLEQKDRGVESVVGQARRRGGGGPPWSWRNRRTRSAGCHPLQAGWIHKVLQGVWRHPPNRMPPIYRGTVRRVRKCRRNGDRRGWRPARSTRAPKYRRGAKFLAWQRLRRRLRGMNSAPEACARGLRSSGSVIGSYRRSAQTSSEPRWLRRALPRALATVDARGRRGRQRQGTGEADELVRRPREGLEQRRRDGGPRSAPTFAGQGARAAGGQPRRARGARAAESTEDVRRRTVHLPAVVVAQLHAHRARQLEGRLRAAQLWEDHGLVFATDLGSPLHATSVTIRFQRVLEGAGLRRQRFHDLRHACASLLLAQGVSPRVVMEVLGHSQVTLTLNAYSHVIPSLGREAADRMDELLRPGPEPAESPGRLAVGSSGTCPPVTSSTGSPSIPRSAGAVPASAATGSGSRSSSASSLRAPASRTSSRTTPGSTRPTSGPASPMPPSSPPIRSSIWPETSAGWAAGQESNGPPPVALRGALSTENVPPFGDTIGPQNPVSDLGGLVPAAGLEPATKGLRVPCSTN